MNFGLPQAYNGLKYDWMLLNENKDKFLLMDENVKFVDLSLFNDIFSFMLKNKGNYFQKNNVTFERNNFIYDLDNFFIRNRSDFSHLFKFSNFQSRDFNLLSEEYFDFYPIIKTYIISSYLNNLSIFNNDNLNLFRNILRFDTTLWSENADKSFNVLLKPDPLLKESVDSFTTLSDIIDMLNQHKSFVADVFSMPAETFDLKYSEYLFDSTDNNKRRFFRLVFDKDTKFGLKYAPSKKETKFLSFFDFPSFFKFISQFPVYQEVSNTHMDSLFSKLEFLKSGLHFYDKRLDQESIYFHAHPEINYLKKLAKDSYMIRRIYEKEMDKLSLAFLLDSLQVEKYKGAVPLFEKMDFNFLYFFPKKYNRSLHRLSPVPSSSLNYRTYDDIQWDILALPKSYIGSNFFKDDFSNFKDNIFYNVINKIPYWSYRFFLENTFDFFKRQMNTSLFWTYVLDNNDYSFDFVHQISKAETHHISLNQIPTDKEDLDLEALKKVSFLSKKKSETDIEKDRDMFFFNIKQQFPLLFIFNNISTNDKSFFLPMFSSFFLFDFNNFKKLRSNGLYDISIFFNNDNYHNVIYRWIVDNIFFHKILRHCAQENINFPE